MILLTSTSSRSISIYKFDKNSRGNIRRKLLKMRMHTIYSIPRQKRFENFRLMARQDWSNMTEDHKAVYRSIALDMNKQSKGEIVDDCSLNQRCKKEVDRHQVDRHFKSDLLVCNIRSSSYKRHRCNDI